MRTHQDGLLVLLDPGGDDEPEAGCSKDRGGAQTRGLQGYTRLTRGTIGAVSGEESTGVREGRLSPAWQHRCEAEGVGNSVCPEVLLDEDHVPGLRRDAE
jgi:hypothetical protein